ncbi:hypothetical protein B0H13DRAFT_2339903 [Mycena leptocephala]|nr:hypothetical protein B0H13DRAFT_2339903 [Mycena leptocephala]
MLSLFSKFSLFNLAAACCVLVALLSILHTGIQTSSRANPKAIQLSPYTSPVWDLGPLPLVRIAIEESRNFEMIGAGADAQWAAIIPPNAPGGILNVSDTSGHRSPAQPYMLSFFHQLRCLDIIRRTYIGEYGREMGGVSRHCMNYLRQTILCRVDSRLEPVREVEGEHTVDVWGDMTCRDWTKVYERADEIGGPGKRD